VILFGRRWLVSIGDVDVSAFDLSFDVVKSTAREPNTAEVRIHNLSSGTRVRLESTQARRLVVRAGYEADGDPPPLLFLGDSRRIYTEREGADLVTTVQASDGGRELLAARISRSYGPGTPKISALRDAVDALGIGRGNLADYASELGSETFADGFVADGPARSVLHTLVRSARMRWSVQNGALQLLRAGEPLQVQAPRLSAATGLVGSPTRDEAGKVSAVCLLQPGLEPGRRVVLAAEQIEGGYEIRRVVYAGASSAQPWYATMELAPL